MREEILRILRLVEQGRLRPEEAMSLLEALGYPEGGTETAEGASTQERVKARAQQERPSEEETNVFERIGRIAGETLKGIDWQGIAETIRTHTQRGLAELRKALDELEQGGWRVGLRWGHEAHTEHQMTFPITAGQTVRIELPLGDVQVIGGFDGGRVEASVTLRGATQQQAQDHAQKWSLMVEQTENGVVVRAPDTEPPTAADVDLKVQIPTGVHVQVKTIRGDVSVRDTQAGVSVTNVQGDVRIENAREKVHVETAGGDLSVKGFQGEQGLVDTKRGDILLQDLQATQLTARSASGDLTLKEIATQQLVAETVRGDLAVELTEPLHGTARLNTVSGDIHLEVPDGNDCQVSLDTVVGEVTCGLPAQQIEKMENRWSGVCGSGSGQLKASTVHGDISVKIRPTKTL